MPSNNKPTCLILGANGFIGSYLVDKLAAEGFQVIAFDRFSNPAKFKDSKNISIVRSDIDNFTEIEKALEKSDAVFHCFSGTTPSTANDNPYVDININLLTTVKLLELAVEHKIKKIVFISSGGGVYGIQSEQGEVSETDRPEPVSPYGICKLAIEHYLGYYKRRYGLDHIIYRVTNPYGPRQAFKHNQGVIPVFIDSFINNKPIEVIGDLDTSRDFIYIDDVVNMIVASFSKITKYNLYNIGYGDQTTLSEIIENLEKIYNKKAVIHQQPAPETFLKRTPISIKRYISEFGAVKQTTLEDGLRKTVGKS